MKLLVDEMPNYKDDCLFAEQRWDGEWITYCKLTNIRCDLDEEECRCLKVQKIYGNEYNCIMTMFGECSYSETGCGDCAVVEKVRNALDCQQQIIYEPTSEQMTTAIEALDEVNDELGVECDRCNWHGFVRGENVEHWFCVRKARHLPCHFDERSKR